MKTLRTIRRAAGVLVATMVSAACESPQSVYDSRYNLWHGNARAAIDVPADMPSHGSDWSIRSVTGGGPNAHGPRGPADKPLINPSFVHGQRRHH